MISFDQYLQEARKNPELNPKISVNQEIINHVDSAKKLSGTAVKNSFVSFTQIHKLGINPGSRYDTPLGIYCYPAEYVKEKTNETLPMSTLPFAGSSPFANIFSVRGNIVDLNNLSNSDLQKYYEKIINFYTDFHGKKKGTEEWKKIVDFIEMIINNAGDKAKFKSNGGKFWYVTMKLAQTLSSYIKPSKNRHSVAWNKLFRELGIDGCVDMGEGIIHTSEPTQAVFFSKRVIAKNKRVDNKYSPYSIGMSVKRGKQLRDNVWEGGTWTGEDDWQIGTWKDGIWKDGIWKDGIWKKGIWKGGMWQNGIWKNGTWEDGSWHDGTWHNGTWQGGTWFGGDWKNGTWKRGTWLVGTWSNGTWESGNWSFGIWNKGTWDDGIWAKGIWNNGTWNKGTWKNGTWVFGIWNDGIWFDGTWENGTWNNGVWRGGTFEKGTWEKGIWENGTWNNGIWRGGRWRNGTWLGGTWIEGKWMGGYDEDGNYHPEGDSPDKW